MKKIIGFLSFIAFFTVTACTDRKPAEVKKEVTVVTAPVPAAPEKKTTIVLDKNGAKVETKKVEVSITPNK